MEDFYLRVDNLVLEIQILRILHELSVKQNLINNRFTVMVNFLFNLYENILRLPYITYSKT